MLRSTGERILDYLLSTDHAIGADKAAFFTPVGYSRNNWAILRTDLLRVFHEGILVSEEPTRFGVNYVIDGLIQTPGDHHVELRTVWISDAPARPARLVTAYPR